MCRFAGCPLAAVLAPSIRFDMAPTPRKLAMTPREFLTHPAAQAASELVRGEVRVMTPAGGAHGVVASRMFAAMNAFVEAHDLGQCFADNTGFQLPGLPDTVRSPDAAFVRKDKLPLDGIDSGWVTVAPDLIVEVRSPTETQRELEEKLRDYQTAGTRHSWIIDPDARTVLLRDDESRDRMLSAHDVIDQIDILPGFSLDVARLFVGLAITSP